MEIIAKEMMEGKINAKETEQLLFSNMQKLYKEELKRIYEVIDQQLYENRDKERYIVKEKRGIQYDTIFGQVEIRRRYYLDRETKEYVFLLDSYLEIEDSSPISPFLEEIAVNWAIKGPSYRDARDRLERITGLQVLSHEAIRQRTKAVGLKINREAWQESKEKDKKGAEVIFIEADGLHSKLQKEKQKAAEAKTGIIYDGWEKRHPGSKEYKLRNKQYWTSLEDGDKFWEETSCLAYKKYEIKENTPVIINGDGAEWIKKGVEYFPCAIYIYDRFHLKKWLRAALKEQPEKLKETLKASNDYDTTKLLKAVAEAEKKSVTEEEKERIKELRRFLLDNIEALRDYREILEEQGIDTSGMRPLGAAESNMDLFAKRIKKQGYSWSREGLKAVMFGKIKELEGTLENWIGTFKSSINTIEKETLDKGAGYITKRIIKESEGVIRGRMPALYGAEQGKDWVNKGLRKIGRVNYEVL